MKKVTDEVILDAVWRCMVIATARGSVTKYVGERYGLAGDRMRHYGQDIHIVSRRILDVPLSNGHLRKRLISLINTGSLKWSVYECTFWIDCERAKLLWDSASRWWESMGVPGGYLEGKGMRCISMENFEDLLEKLELKLLSEFGERQ